MAPFGSSRCKSQANGKAAKEKRYNEHPDRTEQRLLAQKEAIERKLAAIRRAKSPATAAATRTAARDTQDQESPSKDYGDQRVVINRYHHSLVGNRPEMCPLDAHLFADLKTAVNRNVTVTAGLDVEDESRFKMGTPTELSETLRRTWSVVPTSERIVEDISRIPSTVAQIVEYKGGVVPDEVVRDGRRKTRGKRPLVLHPDAAAAAEELMHELRSEVKRTCGRES